MYAIQHYEDEWIEVMQFDELTDAQNALIDMTYNHNGRFKLVEMEHGA